MRFSAVHKASSYLMIASAFSAIALSGELPSIWVALIVLAGAASWFVEPARFPPARSRLWGRVWTAATLGALAWTVGDVLRGEPAILAGVRFLCFFLVNKLWNRRASRDYQQAYVLSFLMLVAGTTINTDLAYALCFVAYVVFATWTLTLFHLRREMEENYLLKHSDGAQSERVEVERILASRRVVGGGFLLGTSLVSLGIFLGSAALFFLFPRVGFGLFFHHGRNGMRMGFNDQGVSLGENGLIKDNDQVVMRVEFPNGKPVEPLYFRGIAFERYALTDGRRKASWSTAPGRSRSNPRGRGGAVVGGVTLVPGALRPDPEHPPKPGEAPHKILRDKINGALEQRIYLEPMGDVSALFAASEPLGYELPTPPFGLPGDEFQADALDDLFAVARQQGIKYTAYSQADRPPEALLAAQEDIDAEQRPELQRSLDVPADIAPRIVELAREVTRSARGPYGKTRAILDYLAKNYRYTINLKRDTRYDPLEDFLFVQKEGHCEYFATALAMMLRAVGVPTRHVAGFYGGEWNPYGNYLQVRQRDAHAWVEVYLGAAGWVSFDPTPPSDAGAEAGGFLDKIRQLADTVQLAWFKYVIEYDLGKQMDLAQSARQWLGRAFSGGAPSGPGIGPWVTAHAREIAVGFGAGLVGLSIWRRRRWRRATDRPARPRRRLKRSRAERALARAVKALEKRGLPQKLGETPAELAERARARGEPAAADLRELVGLYYAARFGGLAVDAAAADQLADRVVRA